MLFFYFGSSARFHSDDWASVSMSLPYTHDSSPGLSLLSKSESSSTSSERCSCDFIFAKNVAIFEQSWLPYVPETSVKIAWHQPNDMPTSSATSLTVIRRLSKIIFFTAFKCFNRMLMCIDIFSSFLKPVISQLNLCSAHRRLANMPQPTFKILLNFFFFFCT